MLPQKDKKKLKNKNKNNFFFCGGGVGNDIK
jgi:hypothetical protein